MVEINLLDKYPRSKRPVDERGKVITEMHRSTARKFDREYFDGERLFGYGGYSYHPRFWTETVKRFRDHYHLSDTARVLDVGCAKGFMLHDFVHLIPKLAVQGIDISSYAIEQAIPDVKPFLNVGNATKLPYPDEYFDLVISINTIHNLPLEECKEALREITRVTKTHSFVTMDAWRNEQQRIDLLKWNLTAQTYMHVNDWKNLFDDVGYEGDYYWFLIE